MQVIVKRISLILTFVLVITSTIVPTFALTLVPNAPTNFNVTDVTTSTILVEFNVTHNPTTSTAQVYLLNISTGATTVQSISVNSQNQITTEFDNLERDTQYKLWATAGNNAGISQISNEFVVTTLRYSATDEQLLPLTPIGFSVKDVTTTSAQIQLYVDQYIPTTGVQIYIQDMADVNSTRLVDTINLDANQISVTYLLDNLSYNTTYKVWAVASNSYGVSSISTTFVITTNGTDTDIPKSPEALNISTLTPISMQVEFYVSQIPITTSANIYIQNGNNVAKHTVDIADNQRIVKYMVNGLSSGTQYTVWATAENQYGESELSDVVTTTTP
ncbi:MAG: hypothetical protein BEN18_02220 [Epulopiscium sp. Nuni2H_MBin001]|nr:MAG: hypothetical protein BEN18_02220 [Epulopiscium sp. Nuni2H_MBin001]